MLRHTRTHEGAVALPAPDVAETVFADYRALQLSLTRHPLALLRDRLAAFKVQPAAVLNGYPNGRLARASGIVTHRQRPETAKGVIFVTLEDETGAVNVIVWPAVAEAQRQPLLASALLTVYGVWQCEGDVRHLVARKLVDHSALLHGLGRRAAAISAGGNGARQSRPCNCRSNGCPLPARQSSRILCPGTASAPTRVGEWRCSRRRCGASSRRAAVLAPDAPDPFDGGAPRPPVVLGRRHHRGQPRRARRRRSSTRCWAGSRATQQRLGVGPVATAIAGFLAGRDPRARDVHCATTASPAACSPGGRYVRLPAAAPRQTTMHLFHGAADPVIDVAHARAALQALGALRGDATLDIAEGVGHVLHPALIDRALFRLRNHIPARIARLRWARCLELQRRGDCG